MPEPLACHAVAPPGIEHLTAGELVWLGITPGHTEPGGVEFHADPADLWAANLHLRTASKILMRLARFHVRGFAELERHAGRVPWDAVVPPGAAVAFRVTSRKSRLYHQRGIAERLLDAIVPRVPGVHPPADGERAQEFVVRLFRDECTISADSSGDLLHLRGYRQAVAKAPLRETLAAAMLLASEWDGTAPLVDPFCGSGTIPIEAALLARRIPPGWQRSFAFEGWPAFDPDRWAEVRTRAEEGILPRAPGTIVGVDRDAGAIEAAIANAKRAGVAEDVEFRCASVSALEVPAGRGWVVANPPYGVRIGEAEALRDLHARFGQILRRRASGWQVAVLSANSRIDGHLGLPLRDRFRTRNGGIPVRLRGGPVTA